MSAVSIIMPIYNAQKYLRECLDSVAQQTFTDWECICIDDGSKDASGAILDEYARKDARIVVRHMPNGGAGRARNLGLRLAKAEYLMFVDADDVIQETMLEVMVAHAEVGHLDMVLCGHVNMDENGVQAVNPSNPFYVSDDGFEDWLQQRFYVIDAPWAKLIRRSGVSDIQFPEDLKHTEDVVAVALWMSRTKRMEILSEKFYRYRQVTSSRSSSEHYSSILGDAYLRAIKFQELAASLKLDRERTMLLHSNGGVGYFFMYYSALLCNTGIKDRRANIRLATKMLRTLVKQKIVKYDGLDKRQRRLYFFGVALGLPEVYGFLLRTRTAMVRSKTV